MNAVFSTNIFSCIVPSRGVTLSSGALPSGQEQPNVSQLTALRIAQRTRASARGGGGHCWERSGSRVATSVLRHGSAAVSPRAALWAVHPSAPWRVVVSRGNMSAPQRVAGLAAVRGVAAAQGTQGPHSPGGRVFAVFTSFGLSVTSGTSVSLSGRTVEWRRGTSRARRCAALGLLRCAVPWNRAMTFADPDGPSEPLILGTGDILWPIPALRNGFRDPFCRMLLQPLSSGLRGPCELPSPAQHRCRLLIGLGDLSSDNCGVVILLPGRKNPFLA